LDRDADPLDPAGGHHRKFYAPGVGVVRIDAIGDTNPEILQLTKFKHQCPERLRSHSPSPAIPSGKPLLSGQRQGWACG
jgi:hypothetical protein